MTGVTGVRVSKVLTGESPAVVAGRRITTCRMGHGPIVVDRQHTMGSHQRAFKPVQEHVDRQRAGFHSSAGLATLRPLSAVIVPISASAAPPNARFDQEYPSNSVESAIATTGTMTPL